MTNSTYIQRWFRRHRGRTINKWNNYMEVYDRHFEPYRNRPVTVVEIGVNHGGSLQLWRDYFGKKAMIHGVDVKESCRQLTEPQIEIHVGDQSDREFLQSLADKLQHIDILIDDGGHTMEQQRTTFDVLYPLVAEDGLFVVEDLNTSYWAEYGGGFRHQDSFVEHTKSLIDELHAWHSETERLTTTPFTTSTFAIHVYRGIVIMEKRPIEEPYSLKSGADHVSQLRSLTEMLPEPATRLIDNVYRTTIGSKR